MPRNKANMTICTKTGELLVLIANEKARREGEKKICI